MGIETIVSEPGADAFDTIEKLCDEYDINVALHNHPEPSQYWNPDTVLKAAGPQQADRRLCRHRPLDALRPQSARALKKLEGRIITFHFKDLNKPGKGAHDVPWGTGRRRQGHAGRDPPPRDQGRVLDRVRVQLGQFRAEIAQCVAYFDKVAAEWRVTRPAETK